MNHKMTDSEFKRYVEQKTPNSPLVKNLFFAYLVGGLICVLGQAFKEFYLSFDMSEALASTGTSVTLIFLGELFTALSLYGKLARHAGAGTIVPITGFANAVCSPALEFKSEGLVTGLSVKLFTVAGPVICYGITASVGAGIIYFIRQCFGI